MVDLPEAQIYCTLRNVSFVHLSSVRFVFLLATFKEFEGEFLSSPIRHTMLVDSKVRRRTMKLHLCVSIRRIFRTEIDFLFEDRRFGKCRWEVWSRRSTTRRWHPMEKRSRETTRRNRTTRWSRRILSTKTELERIRKTCLQANDSSRSINANWTRNRRKTNVEEKSENFTETRASAACRDGKSRRISFE